MRLDTVILWNVTVIGLPFHSRIQYLVHNQNVDKNIRVKKTPSVNTQNNKINLLILVLECPIAAVGEV